MKACAGSGQNERGVALPLALFALVMLSGLLLAFLSMSGMEPSIAANLSDVTRARYVAEAGIEWAFDQMVATSGQPNGWSGILQTKGGQIATDVALPGLTAASGTFSVTVRNDSQGGDEQMTGWTNPATGKPGPDPGGKDSDTNGIVILLATGNYNGVNRQIQVVMSRIQLPIFPGAVNMPGVQADVTFWQTNFDVDGRDYSCDGCKTATDFNTDSNWAPGSDQSQMGYGLAVHSGKQKHVEPDTQTMTTEQRAEEGLKDPDKAMAEKKNRNFKGRDQRGAAGKVVTGTEPSPQGEFTIATDDRLDMPGVQSFMDTIKKFSGTQVLDSTYDCNAVVTANSDPKKANQPTLSYVSKGGADCSKYKPRTLDLGTPENPQLTYFKPDLQWKGAFEGLGMKGPGFIQGAGILIVEDGDLSTYTDIRWDGIIIVAGKEVGFGVKSNTFKIYGALVSMETVEDEVLLMKSDKTYGYMGDFNTVAGVTFAQFRNSSQNMRMVQGIRNFHRLSSWREM